MKDKRVFNSIPTINDVAKLANSSKSTVSRVINNQGGVSKDLEEKIRDAIDVLKFKPNKVARALKARSTKSIGLIIPTVENPVFAPLVKIIETTADKYGFSTILCNSDGVVEKESKYLELLIEKQVDGIIFNAIGEFHKGFEIVKDTNTPIVVLGKKIEGFETTNVTVNNFRGAYIAVEHLIKIGMRNIAFLFGKLEANSAIFDRFEGYKSALDDNNIIFNEELVVRGKNSFEDGESATNELIQRGVNFDSIFASNDILAIGCIERLIDKGYSIPKDVSVIGYDDIPASRVIRPKLSTVLNAPDVFGTEAVKTILRIIYSKKDTYQERMFEPELIIRDSTRQL